MNKFKTLEKLFKRNLATCFDQNGIKINKEEFFQFMVESKFVASFGWFCESYTPATENVINWLHKQHFIDKNKQITMDNIYCSIESFVEKACLDNINIQVEYETYDPNKQPHIFKRILHLV